MTLKARLLFAVGMAVLALGAIGGILVTTHAPAKPTVQLHIVGATAPVVAGTPSAVATTTSPAATAQTTTAAVAPATTVPRKVSPVRTRTASTPVTHLRAVATTSTPRTTTRTYAPKVTLIPPIQCTPQLGCGPMKP